MEERLNRMDQELQQLPGQVHEISGSLQELASHRKDADAAAKRMNELESVLSDVESRMQELQTAREWLARTETRLEEVSREAQEQVKLLGSLMKDESGGKKGDKSRGAPSLSARDMVIKLAHQGWKVEEISKAVQVSRGEVELILELAGKQG
jgi:chromosome segregation ATPase